MAPSSIRLITSLRYPVARAAEAGRGGAAALRLRGQAMPVALPGVFRMPPQPFIGTTSASSSFPGAIGAVRCYSEEVLDHFQNPRNVGTFPKDEPNVGTALVGKAACGDVIKLQVKVRDGVICDAKFKTFGCGSAIASSSYATELIKGKTTEAALGVTNRQISGHLNLPPVKLHCSLLAEDAVRLAIRDYEEKEKQRREGDKRGCSSAGEGSGSNGSSDDGAKAEGAKTTK